MAQKVTHNKQMTEMERMAWLISEYEKTIAEWDRYSRDKYKKHSLEYKKLCQNLEKLKKGGK